MPDPTTYNAKKGYRTRFIATVTGTIEPATEGYEIPQGVVWSIGGTEGAPLSMGTFIDAEGVLHVDRDELNESIVIGATSTVNREVSATATISIIEDSSDESGDDSGDDSGQS